MSRKTKRVQIKQSKPKVQQFLQQFNNSKFKMVLVEQDKQPVASLKQSSDKCITSDAPPIEFKPTATSTPKRRSTSAEDRGTKRESHVTMSQFLGEVPRNFDKPPPQVAVKLRNFLSEASKPFETVVINDFTDENSHSVENKEKVQVPAPPVTSPNHLRQKQGVETPQSNLDTTKDCLRTIFNRELSSGTVIFRSIVESILNATDGKGPSRKSLENPLMRRFKPFAVPSVPNTISQRRATTALRLPIKDYTSPSLSSFLNPTDQQLLRSHGFEKDLNNCSCKGSIRGTHRIANEVVEFWKKDKDLSFVGNLV